MSASLLLLLTASAAAQGASSEAFTPRPVAGHAVFDLRVGVDRVDATHPYLCAEGAPLQWLSIEMCGTGQGLLHRSDEPDMAHFRTRARALSGAVGRTQADLLFGLGFAEIQRTADEPGFRFGKATEADPIEAAGPEASVSLKGRYWVDRGGRTYLTADLNAGAAAIPAAPAVLGTGGPLVPFAAFTLGWGF